MTANNTAGQRTLSEEGRVLLDRMKNGGNWSALTPKELLEEYLKNIKRAEKEILIVVGGYDDSFDYPDLFRDIVTALLEKVEVGLLVTVVIGWQLPAPAALAFKPLIDDSCEHKNLNLFSWIDTLPYPRGIVVDKEFGFFDPN